MPLQGPGSACFVFNLTLELSSTCSDLVSDLSSESLHRTDRGPSGKMCILFPTCFVPWLRAGCVWFGFWLGNTLSSLCLSYSNSEKDD